MRLPLCATRPLLCATAMAVLTGCSTLKKIHLPWRKKAKPAAAVVARPQFVGTVVLVNAETRFVLIDAGNSALPRAGTALKTMSGETETGVITVGDVRKRPFAVADIVRGEPKKGDRVFE